MSESAVGSVRVEEVELPGIGMRYDLMTHKGRRVGVLKHRSGRRDLLVFSREDPDACSETVRMTDEESAVLGELLGVPRIVDTLTGIPVEGLLSEQIPIEPDSPYANRTLGETQARTRTGASIVAVIRGQETIISPTPDFRFQAGDVVVVVGTREGVRDRTPMQPICDALPLYGARSRVDGRAHSAPQRRLASEPPGRPIPRRPRSTPS